MAEFEQYLSDGEGPTRVYPMYRDENGVWQILPGPVVEGTYIDLEFHDAWDSEPIGPSVWDEQFREDRVYYKTVIGRKIKKSAGFRYFLRIEWPAGSLADRGDITGIASSGIGQRFRVYPHNDSTLVHFDCTISDSNVTARHHVEGSRYPDYSPMIEFMGVHIVAFIPHNYSQYHHHFLDKTAWGAYTIGERLRGTTMRDKTPAVWATYLATDYEGYFTRKSLEHPVPNP